MKIFIYCWCCEDLLLPYLSQCKSYLKYAFLRYLDSSVLCWVKLYLLVMCCSASPSGMLEYNHLTSKIISFWSMFTILRIWMLCSEYMTFSLILQAPMTYPPINFLVLEPRSWKHWVLMVMGIRFLDFVVVPSLCCFNDIESYLMINICAIEVTGTKILRILRRKYYVK